MRSRSYELSRRALPLVAYVAREAADERIDEDTRALLVTLGEDLVERIGEVVDVLGGDEADSNARRDVARARDRITTAYRAFGGAHGNLAR